MRIQEQIFDETAAALKTLGHPIRLVILATLARTKSPGLPVKEIQEKLKVAQPEASKHLIVMKNQSILRTEKKNGFSFYSINPDLPYLEALIQHLPRMAK